MVSGNRWRLQLLIAVAAMIVVIVLAAIVYPRTTYVVPDQGGAYVEAIAGQPKFLNPILASPDSIDRDLASLIFSGLTKLNAQGEPVPDLALSWDVSADNKTYTFALRDGVQWHDGTPFSAADVVFTIRAMQDPAYQGSPELAQLWRSVRVEQLDPRTVRFQLANAYAPFPEFASIGILPAHLLRAVPAKELGGQAFNARPVGTGRFRVKAASRAELVLDANPSYYGPPPYLATLRFRFLPDNDKAIAALRRQEAQGVRRLAPEELAAARQVKTADVYSAPDLSKLTLLLFNTRAAIFNEKAVRQAIAYGLDRQRLIEVALGGQGLHADGPVPPASWAYKGDLPKYEYRPEAARALLEAAGWAEGKDGARERGSTPLSFILLTNDKPLRVRTAEEIARQLATIGIRVTVQTTGWSGFVQDFLVPRKFQAVLTEQWSPNFDPDGYPFWHSSQIANGLNFASWTNRRADEVLENARRSADKQVRLPLYGEFQSIFAEELPAVPLYYPLYNFAVDRSVKGVRLGPLVETANRFDYLAEWYVMTKRVTTAPTPTP